MERTEEIKIHISLSLFIFHFYSLSYLMLIIKYFVFQHRPVAGPSQAGAEASHRKAEALKTQTLPVLDPVHQEQLRVHHVSDSLLSSQLRALRREDRGISER